MEFNSNNLISALTGEIYCPGCMYKYRGVPHLSDCSNHPNNIPGHVTVTLPFIQHEENPIPYQKKPYKCPVCDGAGYKYATLQSHTEPEIKCHACKGKGIVWG